MKLSQSAIARHTRPVRGDLPLVRNLLHWFARSARDLPWRRTRDPYAIWISEVMLQQTQVKTVIPYWERWMRHFPTVEKLAAAPIEAVLKLWEGLGYYSRARQLHRAAQQVMRDHDGALPTAAHALQDLPGIGHYTAGAISSIAFGQPEPVVDGNVSRVLARCFGLEAEPRSPQAANEFWETARRLVICAAENQPPGACGSLNEALMELGALVCTPRNPSCGVCPLRRRCVARRHDRIDELPRVAPRPTIVARTVAAFIVAQRGRLLVRQRPEGIVNGGLWEFPNAEIRTDRDLHAAATKALGSGSVKLEFWWEFQHSITRYRITVRAFFAHAPSRMKISKANGCWCTLEELHARPFPSAHRKILMKLIDQKAKRTVNYSRSGRQDAQS